MAIYLKKFETQAAYEAAESGLILPNVSLTVDNNTVHYNPTSPVPPTPQHDYVEIGGIKWATMNIGASNVTDAGLYFQWGDISGYTAAQCGSGEGQKYFGAADYKYCNGGWSSNNMTKYNSTDGKTVLESSDDAAQANWGGSWRMPTTEEFVALMDAVNSAWTNSYQGSGVSGLVLTDKTDDSKVLFFPAVGRCSYGKFTMTGEIGDYWTSSLYNSDKQRSHFFGFTSNVVEWFRDNRYNGFSVRGILDE